MRSFWTIALTVYGFMVGAQHIELPRESPRASVGMAIGLTDINIRYGAPVVTAKQIWGELVPYDDVWRAGADEATLISFSTDVKIEEQPLAAGTYSLMLIPGKELWTVVFNRDTSLNGIDDYSMNDDVLRVIVRSSQSAITEERLNYSINNQGFDNGYIRFAWDKVRLFIRIKTDVIQHAITNIDTAIARSSGDTLWQNHLTAASFYHKHKFYDRAINHLDASMSIKTTSENLWKKAKIYADKSDWELAIAAGQAAEALGNSDFEDTYFQADSVSYKGMMEGWQRQLETNEE